MQSQICYRRICNPDLNQHYISSLLTISKDCFGIVRLTINDRVRFVLKIVEFRNFVLIYHRMVFDFDLKVGAPRSVCVVVFFVLFAPKQSGQALTQNNPATAGRKKVRICQNSHPAYRRQVHEAERWPAPAWRQTGANPPTAPIRIVLGIRLARLALRWFAMGKPLSSPSCESADF